MIKLDKKPKGFSLVEVLIGLIILAIGLLALGSLQVTSVKGNFFSNHLTQATYVAQNRLEFLRTLPLHDPLLVAGNHEDGMTTVSGISFNRLFTVVDEVAGYKTIQYIVTWKDGAAHRISFATIRSQ